MTSPFMHTVDRLPINIVEADGPYLIDDTGKRYLDFWGDEGVASLGYGSNQRPTPLWAAFRDFMKGTIHRLPDMYPNPQRTAAAELLCQSMKFDQAFFCNSGAEANEAMIKLARRYWAVTKEQPDRNIILTVEGNFHGRSGYALAASDSIDSPYHKLGYGPSPQGFGVIHDDLFADRVRYWDGNKYLNTVVPWDRVAAVIMAPILGNNVVKTYPSSFWARLHQLRAEHGFLLLFDEVQVAMGRTGTFAAHHNPAITYGVRPDIMAVGKGLAMGLPAAAILADQEHARAFTPGVHFSTFGASLIVCHMMTAALKFVGENKAHIDTIGNMVRTDFQRAFDDGVFTAFDGAGVHWGFTPDWDHLKTTGPEFCARARDNGLLICTHRPRGPIRFTPPLNITEGQMEEALKALHQTVAQLLWDQA